MAGTYAGGVKARDTNKAKHGEDFYKHIGAIGGRNGKTGGFAADVACQCSDITGDHYKRNCAGMRGGRISRRTGKRNLPKIVAPVTDQRPTDSDLIAQEV